MKDHSIQSLEDPSDYKDEFTVLSTESQNGIEIVVRGRIRTFPNSMITAMPSCVDANKRSIFQEVLGTLKQPFKHQ